MVKRNYKFVPRNTAAPLHQKRSRVKEKAVQARLVPLAMVGWFPAWSFRACFNVLGAELFETVTVSTLYINSQHVCFAFNLHANPSYSTSEVTWLQLSSAWLWETVVSQLINSSCYLIIHIPFSLLRNKQSHSTCSGSVAVGGNLA